MGFRPTGREGKTIFSVLFIGALSLSLTKLVVVDFFDSILAPRVLTRFPDLESDIFFLRGGLAAATGYLSMAALCYLADAFLLAYRPDLLPVLKAQGAKSTFSRRNFALATGVSLMNLLLVSPWVFFALWWYGGWKTRLLEAGYLGSESVWPGVSWRSSLYLVVHALTVNTVFYWTHLVLHKKLFYKPIHKLHHQFKAPTACASMYAHPVEFALGNLLGVILGPYITGCHPVEASFWVLMSLVATGAGHSGYLCLGALYHDRHHQYFDYNFGVGALWDTIVGTEYPEGVTPNNSEKIK